MTKSEKQPEISDWRTRIDELDLELVRMLNERARCAIEIGKIKRKRRMPIYDPRREEEIIRMVVEYNQGPLDGEGIRRLFERIIDESRRIERVTADTTRTQRHQDSE
jgi:chorismate mutase